MKLISVLLATCAMVCVGGSLAATTAFQGTPLWWFFLSLKLWLLLYVDWWQESGLYSCVSTVNHDSHLYILFKRHLEVTHFIVRKKSFEILSIWAHDLLTVESTLIDILWHVCLKFIADIWIHLGTKRIFCLWNHRKFLTSWHLWVSPTHTYVILVKHKCSASSFPLFGVSTGTNTYTRIQCICGREGSAQHLCATDSLDI